MACSCGSKKNAPRTFVHTATDGVTKRVFSSEAAAESHKTIHGGTVTAQK